MPKNLVTSLLGTVVETEPSRAPSPSNARSVAVGPNSRSPLPTYIPTARCSTSKVRTRVASGSGDGVVLSSTRDVGGDWVFARSAVLVVRRGVRISSSRISRPRSA